MTLQIYKRKWGKGKREDKKTKQKGEKRVEGKVVQT